MTHTMVVGTTEPQDLQLSDDGVNLDGTGLTVGLVWRVAPGGSPTVAWLSQSSGTVRVSGCGSMAVGTYYVRFSLTDGGGLVGYAPNVKSPFIWHVVAA